MHDNQGAAIRTYFRLLSGEKKTFSSKEPAVTWVVNQLTSGNKRWHPTTTNQNTALLDHGVYTTFSESVDFMMIYQAEYVYKKLYKVRKYDADPDALLLTS